jgi:predicted MFS family arabinose efflux permease
MQTTVTGSRASSESEPRVAHFLFVLVVIGAVNWADRLVVPILFPGIRRDLGLTDTELGVVGGMAFSLVYAAASFAFGYAADRGRRTRLIALGLLVWSAGTAAGGLATSFWPLFWARFFTGVGEASLYPCALSLIADRFPIAQRGRALGIFASSAAMGGGFGVGLGGRLSQTIGWQHVFFLYGAVGVACLPLLFTLREERREADSRTEPPGLAVARTLRDARLRWLWATGATAMASAQAFSAWAPSYFVRQLGMSVTKAGQLFGAAALVGGIAGGLVGGFLADRRGKLRPGGELDVAVGAAFVGAILVGVTLETGRGALSGATALGATLAVYAIFPGLLALMLSSVPSHRHGMAGALNTLFLGGVGPAAGPFLVGAASDAIGDLHVALYIPIAGLCLTGLLALQTRKVVRRQAGSI